jgi:parallel beta-helix repeat protein
MTTRVLLVVLLALYGCGDSDNDGSSTVRVHPGESIQAAIDAAPPNSTIMVEPGVYHESPGEPSAVVVTKNGLRLIALSTPGAPVVLENAGDQRNGFWVSPADSVTNGDTEEGEHPPCGTTDELLHGFLLKGFTVRGFAQYGVYLACVDDFTLTRNLAQDDQVYGLFPVRSHHGTVSDNEAAGTLLDAALYVGQSDHVVIINNRSHDNLLGLEIENSSDITATGNDLFANTAGLIADINAQLQKTDQTNIVIADNTVHDNNRPNTIEEGSISETPSGTGLVVLGGSMVTVRSNTLANNGFQGIIVSSYCTGLPMACTDLDIDPNPRDVHVLDNRLLNNGTAETDPVLAHFAADLFWDHVGQGNCWSGNTPTATIAVLGGTSLPSCS